MICPRPDWDSHTKLEKEKEVIDFYLSAHPFETYADQLKWFALTPFTLLEKQIKEYNGEHEFFTVTAGLIKSKKEIVTKKGDRMAFVKLEDTQSSAEIILFPKIFAQVSPWLETHHIFVVKGTVDLTTTKGCKIIANEFIPAELIFQKWKKMTKISLGLPQKIDETLLENLKNLIRRDGGTIPLIFTFWENGKKLELRAKKPVTIDQQMLQQLENMGISAHINL